MMFSVGASPYENLHGMTYDLQITTLIYYHIGYGNYYFTVIYGFVGAEFNHVLLNHQIVQHYGIQSRLVIYRHGNNQITYSIYSNQIR